MAVGKSRNHESGSRHLGGHAEVVMKNVSEGDYSDDELQLLPEEGLSRAELIALHNDQPLPTEPDQAVLVPGKPDLRFSLFELLLLVTFAAFGLGGGRWLSTALFAGVTGLMGLVLLVALAVAAPGSRLERLAWWCLTALYVMAVCSAIFHSGNRF